MIDEKSRMPLSAGLMRRAAGEMRHLRRVNEVMAAKLEGIEIALLLLRTTLPPSGFMEAREDTAATLEKEAESIELRGGVRRESVMPSAPGDVEAARGIRPPAPPIMPQEPAGQQRQEIDAGI